MLDTLKIKLQYLLPKQCLTQLAGRFANKKLGWLTQLVIKAFAKAYKVDMQEAKESEFIAYSTFNEFFIRALKEEVRPIVQGSETWHCRQTAPSVSWGLSVTIRFYRPKGITTPWKPCSPETGSWRICSATGSL